MSSESDVVISNFINPHLFWIIQKKDIILRLAMGKIMKAQCRKTINRTEEICVEQMVAVLIDGIWARGVIENIIQTHDDIKHICWLLDYGVMTTVHCIFHLPDDLENCPPLARQASLHNVVNLTRDLVLGDGGYKLVLRKTVIVDQGVIKAALEYLEGANKTIFAMICDDGNTIYGDIILVYDNNKRNSLTQSLISEELLAEDEEMFKTMVPMREQIKEVFFQNSPNWLQKLEHPEKELCKRICNNDKNIAMEFFARPSHSNSFVNGNA